MNLKFLDGLKKVDNLYKKHGDKAYIGENISQREHVVQSALLAETYLENIACEDDTRSSIILGALFHDVGNLLMYEYPNQFKLTADLGILDHEVHGSNYLRNLGFNEFICSLVKNHVYTKRYLITKNPEYFNVLSDASKKTFEYQGGLLTELEIQNYENDPNFKWHLKMREWDDMAKSTDRTLLEKIKNMDLVRYFSKYT